MIDETKKQELIATVQALMSPGKGILAADESNPSVEKRFSPIGLENTEENRRAFRELFFTAPGANQYISGVILYDETIRQQGSSGQQFTEVLKTAGIIPGIKVDQGTEPMASSPSEKLTKGLEGLPQRLSEYYGMGARFAKWRGVITIGEGLPTHENLVENARILTQYAKDCQEAGIVPIVEPEVLMDGSHTIERCGEVTVAIQTELFKQLSEAGVSMEGLILKSNMVIDGKDSGVVSPATDVSEATLRTFKQTVPKNIGGIVFLSGGQNGVRATENLNEMNKHKDLPWRLSFSYARALQDAATKAWAGKQENIAAGQAAFLLRAKLNSLATTGSYASSMEEVHGQDFGEAQASQD